MTKWAESSDYGPEEWEEFHYPASGQDYAFRFFNMQDFALSEALGVKVVEGDRPGSNYFAAELRISAEDANSRAAGHGIPVRFEQQAGQIGALVFDPTVVGFDDVTVHDGILVSRRVCEDQLSQKPYKFKSLICHIVTVSPMDASHS